MRSKVIETHRKMYYELIFFVKKYDEIYRITQKVIKTSARLKIAKY